MRPTVLIPCYNEVSTILSVLAMVAAALPHMEKEILGVRAQRDGVKVLWHLTTFLF
jgi:hypothetical protein